MFLDNPVTRARLEDIGVLDAKAATELGVVGPFARASGIDFDARRDMPYDAYALFKITPAVEKGGDALARTMVRWEEVTTSIQLVREAIKDLPQGDIIDEAMLFKNPEYRREGVSGVLGVYTYLYPEPGEWTGLAEATRGLTMTQIWTTIEQLVAYSNQTKQPISFSIHGYGKS
ncbi:TPA: NADH-quinone oxidoreductase subunit D [Pyrobaculum aerophilum]|uniref:NADH-quinone oxidoreductase subunit D n=1 Tax=Pyrobaculum aerophilum TaxID=13773 RepID=A0A832SYJ6_9CREN|nr:NADH-quinone oxidoreductase subunit D [Pyrobaculum aerophilum]